MTSVGRDIVVISAFHSLIRHGDIKTGVAGGAGNAYPYGFHRGSCYPVIFNEYPAIHLYKHVILLLYKTTTI